jgi:hypothetical protein
MSTESKLSTKSAFALGAGSALVVVALAFFAVRHDGRADVVMAQPAPTVTQESAPAVQVMTTGELSPHAKSPHTMPPIPPAAADSPSVLSGTIELDPAAAAKVSGKVIVFVIARTGSGKGHPVFAKRLDVTSFPAAFSLSAADSMMGQAPPETVSLEARIDLDGDAMTREANAPSAKNESVAIGSHDVKLTLK